jgi:hypothetical protein
MGGTGGGSYTNWSQEKLTSDVRRDNRRSAAEFENELSLHLGELLASFNGRDVELVRERLDAAKSALEDTVEARLDQIYGGSVSKHTYVDGLSDIDSLLIVNGSEFENLDPPKVVQNMEKVLLKNFQGIAEVTHGHMAVTITYPDGMSIQLLPAIRTEQGLKVPSPFGATWSEINPEGFTRALTDTNNRCGRKLVPMIKLAKALISNLPEQYQLSGYHVESLAIAAFRDYGGTHTTAAMLPYFFQRAKELVLAPIRDRTGQSIHVDEYLGEENSAQRHYISRLLANLGKKMTNASAAQSWSQWEILFSGE